MSCTVYIKNSSDMSEVPDESVQLVVTTPPEVEICDPEIRDILMEVRRVLKPGGFFAFNVGLPIEKSCFGDYLAFHAHNCAKRILAVTGLSYVWTVIGVFQEISNIPVVWDRRRRLVNSYECWLLFSKGEHEFKMEANDVLHYPNPGKFTSEYALRWVIELTTLKGDVVLDPFAGTGTTGKIAVALGRGAIMYEYDPRLVPKIREKVKDVNVMGEAKV